MAELVSIKRNVDVSPGQAAPAVFHCSQGDVGSKIILGLLNNGTAYSIPSGVTVTIEGSESNGSIFTPISATASGSDITFYLTGEMTAVAGPAICQAVLKSGSNILGTANFTLEVESSPMGADAPPVFTDAGWTWMLNKLTTEFVPALGDNIIDAIDSKLGKNQGIANAGKYLKVGADGNVETADLDVTTDKTLSVADKAADAKAVGDEITSLKADLKDISTVGINLFDQNALADLTGIEKNGDEFYGKAPNLSTNMYIDGGYEENTQYTLSMSAYNSTTGNTGNGIVVNVFYSDGTNERIILYNRSTDAFLRKFGTSASNKTVLYFRLSYANGVNDVWHVKEMQIEEGTTATAYVPYTLTAYDRYAREIALKTLSLDRNTNVTFLKAGDDLNNVGVGNYKVLNQSVASQISNMPTTYGGRIVVLTLNSEDNMFQLYMGIDRSTYYRNKLSTGWAEWHQIDNKILSDGVNATARIRTLLNFNYHVRLGAGTFYINNLIMPEGTTLEGEGDATKIIMVETATGSAIKMSNRCTIKNLTLLGSDSNLTVSGEIADRNGIAWSVSDSQFGIVENCRISDFTGGGIIAEDTGTPVDNNLAISNCFITRCNVGIYIKKNSEFMKISNNTIVKNYYGVLNRGGNNNIANCGIDANVINVQVDNDEGTNGGHGAITNCSLNHADSNNGYGLIIKGTGRMLVSNCNFYYAKIKLKSTNGNVIANCGLGNASIEIDAGDNNANIIANCMFKVATGSLVVTSGIVKLSNNWSRNGAELTTAET